VENRQYKTIEDLEILHASVKKDIKKQERLKWFPRIFILLNVVMFFRAPYYELFPLMILAIILIIVGVKWLWYYGNNINAINTYFNKVFKENLVVAALSEAMTVISYKPDSCFSADIINESQILHFSKYSGNDLLEAEYNGHRFKQSDLHLLEEYEERDEDGHYHTHYRTCFRGRLMIIDYDIFTDTKVFVMDRGKRLSEEALIREQGQENSIHTESAEFNKRFRIVSSSPVDALRVLTPHMITGILDANDRLGVAINFCFKNDKIYFAWGSGNDPMETDSTGRKTVAEQIIQIKNDIKAITDFLDSFPLRTLKQ
jgi:hypothetical protein